MFSTDGQNILVQFTYWIWQILQFKIPGLSVTLWQAFMALFMLKFVFKLAMNLLNTHVSGISYRGSSYHGNDDVYKNWNVNDTDWESDW